VAILHLKVILVEMVLYQIDAQVAAELAVLVLHRLLILAQELEALALEHTQHGQVLHHLVLVVITQVEVQVEMVVVLLLLVVQVAVVLVQEHPVGKERYLE
jgi:hypothetical protein